MAAIKLLFILRDRGMGEGRREGASREDRSLFQTEINLKIFISNWDKLPNKTEILYFCQQALLPRGSCCCFFFKSESVSKCVHAPLLQRNGSVQTAQQSEVTPILYRYTRTCGSLSRVYPSDDIHEAQKGLAESRIGNLTKCTEYKLVR